MLFGIVDGVPDMIDFLFFIEGADRTGENALSAVNAGSICHAHIVGGTNLGFEPAVDERKQSDLLHLLAGAHTPAAFDAFGIVAHDGSGQIVDFACASDTVERIAADAILLTQILELAVFVADALQTSLVMV